METIPQKLNAHMRRTTEESRKVVSSHLFLSRGVISEMNVDPKNVNSRTHKEPEKEILRSHVLEESLNVDGFRGMTRNGSS